MTDTAPETKLLPAMSERGDNAYYIDHCDVVQHTPSYAACLSKIARNVAGTLGLVHKDCGAAIDRGSCKAAKMQREEKAEGVALYYMPRSVVAAAADVIASAGAARAWEKFGGNQPDVKQRKVNREAPVLAVPEVADFSAGVGQAISRLSKEDLKQVADEAEAEQDMEAAAINVTAPAKPASKPAPKPRAKKAPAVAVAAPRESNLELARRMAAAKKLA